jgi:hypothetical protein
MSDFRIITAYNGKNNDIILPFLERLIKYSTYNGYKFSFDIEKFDNAQYKLQYINEQLHKESEKYIVWIDIDIFIRNLNTRLESIINLNYDISVSSDNNGICTGFMAIKNNEWNKNLFNSLTFLGQTDDIDLISTSRIGGFLIKNGSHFDQDSMKVIFNYYKECKNHIYFIDENIIQNPESTFNEYAFAYHFWGMWNNSYATILEKINKVKMSI